jgi:predicted RNase H-like HicB family nuclease
MPTKIREAIRLIERDGWYFGGNSGQPSTIQAPAKVRQGDSRRQRIRRSSARDIQQPEGAALMRYAVVIEKAEGNYSAYVPDLPGCVATGATLEVIEENIRDAIRFHIEGLVEDNLPVPKPVARAEYVDA